MLARSIFDRKRSEAFIRHWSGWDDKLHGRLAKAMRDQQKYRYRLFKYAALGE